MFRTALRGLGILIVLFVLIATAPGAWADPGERGRGRSDRSDRADERGRDRSDEDSPDDDGEAAEEERPDEEGADRRETPSRTEHENASGADEDPSEENPADLAEILDVTFKVDPARIAPGETSTLTLTASNSGEKTIGSLELLAELPGTFGLVSSEPAAHHQRGTLAIRLGSLAAEDTVEAVLVVRALAAPTAPGSPVRFALVADDQVFHHEVMVEVDPDGSAGLQLVQSGPLLVQVGDVGAFRLTVSNPSDTPLRDVAVVTQIAPELDVVGVTPILEADAIQLGSSRFGEDVVWIFHELAPTESVELFWTARAAVPGDLEANNETVALVEGHEVADSVQRTYLGYVDPLQVEREDDPPAVVQRRVITKLVPVSRKVTAATAGLLPVTGAAPAAVTGAAIISIVLGLACLWLSGRSRSLRHGGVVAIIALLLTTTACVSSDEAPSDAGPEARQQTGERPGKPHVESEPDVESEREDEVLGLRIERDRRETDPSGSDAAAPTDIDSPEPAAADPDQVVFEEVTVVESVLIPAASLPVREMSESSGDNLISITWERGSNELNAVSSRTLQVDATEELLTSVVASGPRLIATVTLRNLAEDRLAVTGRLRLEISHGEISSTLYSETTEAVLDQGEEVSADFTFSLPDGSFALRGGFEPH